MNFCIRLLFLFCICSVATSLLAGDSGFLRLVQAREELRALKKQELQMLQKVRAYEAAVERARSDEEYLKLRAREDLLVAAEDEIVYVLPTTDAHE